MKITTVCALLAFGYCGLAAAANCTVAATDAPFGNIRQLDPVPVDVQGMVSVDCQAEAADLAGMPAMANIVYSIRVSAGTSGTALARGMQQIGGAEMLPYNVYVDAGHQSVWGDGNNGTAQNSGQFVYSQTEVDQGQHKTAQHLSHTRVPANIDVPPSDYADMLVVTLSF